MTRIGFIGAGTVGTALAVSLARCGYAVTGVASRALASAQRLGSRVAGCRALLTAQDVADLCDLVFITTPDEAIGPVAQRVRWRPGSSVVHCSGADSTDILEPARLAGAHVGCFHPLQTLVSLEYALDNLPGSTFALEGEEPLLGLLKQMALDLGGRWVVLRPEDKVLYHTAAVLACNYLVTLVKLSTDLWKTFGVGQKEAAEALLPLLRGTINNIARVGLPHCLTGPIARGDTLTVIKHLTALGQEAPQLLAVYRELALQTIPIALAKGRLDSQKAKELRQLLLAWLGPEAPAGSKGG